METKFFEEIIFLQSRISDTVRPVGLSRAAFSENKTLWLSRNSFSKAIVSDNASPVDPGWAQFFDSQFEGGKA